jgi:tubulin alpha
MGREVISIHVGQTGVNLSIPCWELLCNEHNLSLDGFPTPEGIIHCDPFFHSCSIGEKQVPRAILVDLEPEAIDKVQTSCCRALFNPSQCISGKEDASNNYARGYYNTGSRVIEETMETIRASVIRCDSPQGFLLFNSISGGTGSGFCSLLHERLSVEYPNKSKIGFCLYPSPKLSTAIVDPYNAVLGTNKMLEHADAIIMFDNEAMYNVAQKRLHFSCPNYSDLNEIVANTVSAVTGSLRFHGDLNIDLAELQTNLVPYPRAHFLLTSLSPLYSSKSNLFEDISVPQITRDVFKPSSLLLGCDTVRSQYIACCLMYRGAVQPRQVNHAVEQLRKEKTIRFVDWCPTGFKCSVNTRPPVHLKGGMLPQVRTVHRVVLCFLCVLCVLRVLCFLYPVCPMCPVTCVSCVSYAMCVLCPVCPVSCVSRIPLRTSRTLSPPTPACIETTEYTRCCDVIQMDRSVCMLANSTAVGEVFHRQSHNFDLMFSKRAFVHWSDQHWPSSGVCTMCTILSSSTRVHLWNTLM